MGFWDLAKDAANAVGEKVNELNAIKMRLESKSSDQLKRLIKEDGFFNTPSEIEIRMAKKILRDRGDI